MPRVTGAISLDTFPITKGENGQKWVSVYFPETDRNLNLISVLVFLADSGFLTFFRNIHGYIYDFKSSILKAFLFKMFNNSQIAIFSRGSIC